MVTQKTPGTSNTKPAHPIAPLLNPLALFVGGVECGPNGSGVEGPSLTALSLIARFKKVGRLPVSSLRNLQKPQPNDEPDKSRCSYQEQYGSRGVFDA